MARSKNHHKTNTGHQASVQNHRSCHCCSDKKTPDQCHHLTPAFLGHRCPQDVHNAIKFHSRTLSDEVCQFLLSKPPNLRVMIKFWSRPKQIALTSGACADTICGCSWMLALHYLFLGKFDDARAFMLNGGFIHQCAQKPIEDILVLCQRGSVPLCDSVVSKELPYYQNAFASSHTREHMEKYLMKVLPPDFVRRMSFAAHSGHQSESGLSTWINDYVSVIGNDWGSSHRSKRVLKGLDNSCIQITMHHTETERSTEMSIRASHALKELFIKYSEEQRVSLRSLRFSFAGKTLFLSSASNKTPLQLGIRNHDVILVSLAASSSLSQDDQEPTNPTRKDDVLSKKVNKKRKCKGVKSRPSSIATISDSAQSHKVKHSQALSELFEEVEPKFRAIRQRLNTLALERTVPKSKSSKMTPTPRVQPVFNANMSGVGGKAGRSSYVIQVGEVDNLYKSSKKSTRPGPKFQMIDLHGHTQLEALNKLNECLPQWEKYAMEGSYPFVALVIIICGGGNQILSETVSKWIKQNNVSNAPKNVFALAA
ncbi:hypothetical protein HJC23_007505 [Cyclotella cryptica]|uniref:Ubiquitin-like domain-containing protein n=1 Tax=Cyclotella cryptica TaxID=29204 RepID=A0ABD3PUD1_9STRA|eukprot:CCRYP_011409-RA/>CCRYP_011409-RA protein AED:0.02 eAED:0.02 QI:1699/-1/1/1/-1/1/1/670/538